MDLPFALEGFFFEKVNGSLSHSTILYMRQPHATQLQKAPFALLAPAESNSAPFAPLHVNGVCRWTSQLLLRGSFSKRSTGRRVNGSTGQTGQWVTFTFTILYMIADDARLTPPRCKKHTGSNRSTGQRVTFTFTILYMIADGVRLTPPCCKKHTVHNDTRLMPHRCKKHTLSFAHSTGKFPSFSKTGQDFEVVDISSVTR